MSSKSKKRSLFEPTIVKKALWDSIRKLNPVYQIKNPVMFVVEVGSILTTLLFIHAVLTGKGEASPSFILQISVWLWITVLFANFAESMAEGRGKAQADSLRKTRRDVMAKRLAKPSPDAEVTKIPSSQLKKGDVVLVEAGDIIPMDGEIIEGVASVNESAVTGESAPVIRESGGDRSAVTGGTTVLSDWLVVRITTSPGETFLDRMISMVEGAKRQKTPNEIALDILLAGMTIIFLLVCVTLLPYSLFSVKAAGRGTPVTITVLVALLVCLIPTTIGGLLSAIGIAGMDRMIQANVIAMSGRAVEAAGDVDVLLLDKTGTITLGNRQATEFIPAPGVHVGALADAAQLASLADETPEGRSIVVLAKEKYSLRARDIQSIKAEFVPFTAQSRMSGVNLDNREVRKGAADAVENYVKKKGGTFPPDVRLIVDDIAKQGATPLVVAEGNKVLGVIRLNDIVKGGIKERFAEMRKMGIKTIMITGDNPLTAAAVAAEAGVDDFLAEATPEAKLKLIREHQKGGRLVAMTGDGTNDAPALAQADVAVAMHTGTQAAKERSRLSASPTTWRNTLRSCLLRSFPSIRRLERSISWAWQRRKARCCLP
jgi:K+-transporting ATPase ATPase B chain